SSPADPPRLPRGWHYHSSLATNGTTTYTFAIPDGCLARELSAALVWNRRFALVHTAPQLPKLDLRLRAAPAGVPGAELTRSESGASGSAPHSLEHIYQRDVPAGFYSWQVVNAATGSYATDYGVAWRAALEPAQTP